MLTVSLLIDSFTRDTATRVKTRQASPATATFYHYQLRKLRAAAGHLPAADVRPHHLHAVAFSNAFVRVVKQLYRWAHGEDLVPVDPFRKLCVPPTGERQRVLADGEVRGLYRSASPRFRVYLFFALHTLCRPQELRELTWGQVDLGRRVIRLTKYKGKGRRREPVGVRLIPLDRAVTRRLGRMLAARPAPPRPADPVLVTATGRPWAYTSQRVQMVRARQRAGLGADAGGERVVAYSIRHTAATSAARDGVRDSELADIMGHSTTSMTRRYLHRTAEDLVAIIDRRRPG